MRLVYALPLCVFLPAAAPAQGTHAPPTREERIAELRRRIERASQVGVVLDRAQLANARLFIENLDAGLNHATVGVVKTVEVFLPSAQAKAWSLVKAGVRAAQIQEAQKEGDLEAEETLQNENMKTVTRDVLKEAAKKTGSQAAGRAYEVTSKGATAVEAALNVRVSAAELSAFGVGWNLDRRLQQAQRKNAARLEALRQELGQLQATKAEVTSRRAAATPSLQVPSASRGSTRPGTGDAPPTPPVLADHSTHLPTATSPYPDHAIGAGVNDADLLEHWRSLGDRAFDGLPHGTRERFYDRYPELKTEAVRRAARTYSPVAELDEAVAGGTLRVPVPGGEVFTPPLAMTPTQKAGYERNAEQIRRETMVRSGSRSSGSPSAAEPDVGGIRLARPNSYRAVQGLEVETSRRIEELRAKSRAKSAPTDSANRQRTP